MLRLIAPRHDDDDDDDDGPEKVTEAPDGCVTPLSLRF